MIRVLHIVISLGRGGIETMLMNYYRHINRDEIQFDFLKHCREETDYEKEAVKYGSRIYCVHSLNPLSVQYRREIDSFFSHHNEYQIVHSHLGCMSSLPLYYAKKHGVPIRISHSHNTDEEHNLKYILKLFYRKKIPGVSSHLFACSQMAGEWMFKNRQFIVMNNSIETENFLFNQDNRERVRNELDVKDAFVIGHVGRFYEQKNHIFLIDIFNEIIKIRPDSRLLLIGVGPLKEIVQKRVNQLGIQDKVIFYGSCSEIGKLESAMDIYVLPSLYEGLPVTLIEAQASGLQCIVSDTITKEVAITDNVKFLSLKRSAAEWARFIISVSNGRRRKNMLSDIKDKGYDIESSSRWLEKFYKEQIES